MLRAKIKNCNESSLLNNILDKPAISIEKIGQKRTKNKKYPQKQSETLGISIQEVQHIKEEVFEENDSFNHEMMEYSDFENTSYIEDKSANEFFFTESINFEAAYADETISPEAVDDLAQLNDLIDFTCTKCRKTSKNPDYFLYKADLQCSGCQATMKFQCTRCKLMFRQFDNAVRHAKQSCPIGESTLLSPTVLNIKKGERCKCSTCGFISQNPLELRNHIRIAHPGEAAYICSRCSRTYKNHDSMRKHLRLCGREPHIVCVFCGYKTKRREHLRVHMQHKHPDPESCHGGGYECPKCNKKYKYLLPMKSHAKICGVVKKTDINSVVGSARVDETEGVAIENIKTE